MDTTRATASQCAACAIKFEDGAWLRLFFDETAELREGKR